MIKFLQKILAPCRSQKTQTSDTNSTGIPLEEIAKFLPSDPIIIEAGAHVGVDSLNMSAFWLKGTIHAFEPVPELFKKLTKFTHASSNVYCYPYALGDSDSFAELHISSGDSDGSSSLLVPKLHLSEHPGVMFNSSIHVQTVTLNSWAEINEIPNVDFLWLDLQGYELQVLKSASTILPTVRAIHTEVSLKEMYHHGPLYAELSQWLYKQGFRVQIESLLWEDMGNVLFVRSELT